MAELIEVLIAEDNDPDALLVKEAIAEIGLPAGVSVVTNGEEALAFLRKEGKFASSPKPNLIILDLGMPRMSGEEFLQKADQLLDGVRVLIMSGSPEMTPAVRSLPYRKVAKPFTGEDFEALMVVLRDMLSNL